MKGIQYFSHDSNARHDIKIQALRSVYGVKGYGMYWIVIEMMRENEKYCLPLNQKIVYIALSRELECTVDEVKQFINDCIYEFGLFVATESEFYSESLVKRMELAEIKRNANRQNGKSGGRPRKHTETITESIEEQKTIIDKPKREKPVRIENETVAQEEEKQDSDEVIYLTDLLIQMIKGNNPQAKTPADLKKWRNDIRLLIADGYSFNQIDLMIRWCQDNDFWKSNILSAKKLREKANTLILQMNRNQKPKAKTWSEEMQELMDWAKGEDAENDEGRSNSAINVDFVKL